MENEWEQQKLKILNSLLGSEHDSLDFSSAVLVSSAFKTANFCLQLEWKEIFRDDS